MWLIFPVVGDLLASSEGFPDLPMSIMFPFLVVHTDKQDMKALNRSRSICEKVR
jgi:hypothetical protein